MTPSHQRHLAAAVAIALLGIAGCESLSREPRKRTVAYQLPEEMCADGTYFRGCFKVGFGECMETTTDLVGKCLSRSRAYPELFPIPAGYTHKDMIRACVRTFYLPTYILFIRKGDECDSESTWIEQRGKR